MVTSMFRTCPRNGVLAKWPCSHERLPAKSVILSIPDCRKRMARKTAARHCENGMGLKMSVDMVLRESYPASQYLTLPVLSRQSRKAWSASSCMSCVIGTERSAGSFCSSR